MITKQSLIVQCVDDSQLEWLRDKNSAYEMWKALADRYEKKSFPDQIHLKRKILSMKMNEEENLEKHILEYEDLLRKLKATDAEVKDDDKICNLLISLPKSYDTVVAILENTKDNKYTEVKSKLV